MKSALLLLGMSVASMCLVGMAVALVMFAVTGRVDVSLWLATTLWLSSGCVIILTTGIVRCSGPDV